jgi:DNA invertase Pin-like site-specific DNA recombinase
MLIGYARVSSLGQSLNAQSDALTAAGAVRLYAEKESGARSDRPQLRRCLEILEAGDVLLITKLDRLARSTKDLLTIIEELKTKGVGLKSLDDSWLDTTGPMGQFIVTMIAAIAELERHTILERTNAGRQRAMANGVRFGRAFKLTEHQKAEVLKRIAEGETYTNIAKSYNVSYMTISRVNAWARVLHECNRAGLRAAQKLFDPGANVGFLYPENS